MIRSDNHGIASIINDLKTEFLEILNTRIQMLRTEFKENVDIWKRALPVLGGAVALVTGGFFAITFAIVAFIRGLFLPNPYAWAIAALIVGFCYVVLGMLGLLMVRRSFSAETIVPKRTLKVLKEDQHWLEKKVA